MNIVFIVGTGRCGSTLVHEILAKHAAFGFISNIEDNILPLNRFGRWNSFLYRTSLGKFTQKGGLRFAPSEAYRLIANEVSPIYADSCRDLTERDVTPWLEMRFRRFFEARTQAQGKSIFLHKYTGWPRIRFFLRIFPQARFIHIVRDGRAVANSWLQMKWWDGFRGPEQWHWGALQGAYRKEWEDSGYSFVVLGALAWKILMDAFWEAERVLPPEQYLRIRFEDVLKNPRGSFGQMLKFCGIDWNGEFERHFARKEFKKDRAQRGRLADLDP